MPYGEYQYSVDDKGRVIIPPSFRTFVEDGMIVTRGLEGCLYIFPLTNWHAMEKAFDELPITDSASRNFVRFFYSGASKVTMDNASRITLPGSLRSFAKVDSNVVIAGAPKRLELWNEELWQANLSDLLTNPPTPERLGGLIG